MEGIHKKEMRGAVLPEKGRPNKTIPEEIQI